MESLHSRLVRIVTNSLLSEQNFRVQGTHIHSAAVTVGSVVYYIVGHTRSVHDALVVIGHLIPPSSCFAMHIISGFGDEQVELPLALNFCFGCRSETDDISSEPKARSLRL